MNYNANEVIGQDNPNDYTPVEFPEIRIESSKFDNSITLTQDNNVINISSLQLNQLRDLFIQIID